ncbi:MAG: DUF642 domain-containing protein [Verrucomicrobiota bacterium]|jgi:hypothetical protein
MAFIKRSFILAAALLGVGLSSHANLLINGSFEQGNFVPTEQGSMLLGVGATDITGWTVENGGLAWDGPTNPYGLTASDGSYFLDLTGDHDNIPYGGVVQSQTISTTIDAVYQLSFDLGSDSHYDTTAVGVQVTAGSASETFTSSLPVNRNQWQTFTFDFTATSANTSISLDGDASNYQEYIGLDNVSVVEVPEPGTLTLVAGPGLLVFAVWRRLRKA